MADASQLIAIAKELRQLQQSSPVTRDALDSWDAAGRRFVAWQHSTFPDVHLPPQVMFYLNDADIRIKDPEYRKDQDEVLDAIISNLEQGIIPKSPGVGVSFHPRWIGIIALVILAIVLWVAR